MAKYRNMNFGIMQKSESTGKLANFILSVNKPDVILDFYNSGYDSLTLRGEIQLAEKWAEIANSMKVPAVQKR
jgi:hypothetical protein